jgi:hypothetical protein
MSSGSDKNAAVFKKVISEARSLREWILNFYREKT